MRRLVFNFILVLVLLVSPGIALAQDDLSGPIYVVQSGDTLWDIARRFRVSVDDLILVNQIIDAGLVKAGDELIIPGLEGIHGRLITRELKIGETLTSLSRDFQVPVNTLARLNHLVSAEELFIGRDVILPVDLQVNPTSGPLLSPRVMLHQGQSLLELAVLQDSQPWHLVLANGLGGTTRIQPGDVLRIKGKTVTEGSEPPGSLPPEMTTLEINKPFALQGITVSFKASLPANYKLEGTFIDRDLTFYTIDGGLRGALQGVHAMTEPGLYPLSLKAVNPDGTEWFLRQQVKVLEGSYPFDPDLSVEPETIDPVVTKPENEQWSALTFPVTGEKLWQGIFTDPVDPDFVDCWPSTYGNRRSYNNSGYLYFHTGLDFCGAVGNSIYAPAGGQVVFAGALSVRGNATVIDHGWGVYTAYLHQSEILVSAGESVNPGQLIGRIGATGRVTGPHLHFEVWVGGVQVDPIEWLQVEFP